MSLVLLIGLVAGIFNLDFHFRPESALINGLGGQGKALGRVILEELYDSRYYEWGAILERFGNAYGLDLILCRSDGRILAGPERPVPSEVMDVLDRLEHDPAEVPQPPPQHPPGVHQQHGGPPGKGPPPHMAPRDPGRPPFGLLPLPPPEKLRFRVGGDTCCARPILSATGLVCRSLFMTGGNTSLLTCFCWPLPPPSPGTVCFSTPCHGCCWQGLCWRRPSFYGFPW